MIENDGDIYPGMIHTLILSTEPLNRKYRRLNGLLVDENLRDVGTDISTILRSNGIKYLSLLNDFKVEGRSWEMGAVMRLMNREGVYSGSVENYDHSKLVEFSIVPGIKQKRQLIKDLKTYEDVPYMSLSR